MNLLDRFILQIGKNKLCSLDDRILISCSGGKDSMVLAHLFRGAGYSIGLMYIDHLSRDGASFADSLYVAKVASKWNIPYYYQKFHFGAHKKSTNFQNQARNFRYRVLHQILKQENYSKIATGHHKQDSIESFFINLSKKAGLEGLLGIEMKRNNTIRPLLHFSPQEIEEYSIKKGIQYVVDHSNYENKYKRNKFRNTVSPKLLKWDKNFMQSAHLSMEHLREANYWIEEEVLRWTQNNLKEEGGTVVIPLDLVKMHHSPKLLLYRILKNKGFNITQVLEILSAKNSGQIWISDQARLNLFQSSLYISKISKSIDYQPINYPFDAQQNEHLGNILTHFSKPQKSKGNIISVPMSKQNSNLVFRKWLPGDYMKFSYGRKKLKKIFLEKKIPVINRSHLWVLAYQNEVFWIEGISFNRNSSNEDLFFIELLKK